MLTTCSRCRLEFADGDSIGSDFQLCQDCWEAACSDQWWSIVAALAPSEDSEVMTEHDPLRIFNPDNAVQNPKDVVGSRKPALHLVPQSANILEAVVFGHGAQKYGGAYNWRVKRVRASIYLSATMRHLAQWLDGHDDDSESGLSHLSHARACLAILIDAQAAGSLIDDRPPAGPACALLQKHTKAIEE